MAMWEKCCKCNTRFAMSDEIYAIAQERKEAFTFYCPNGHPQHYVTGESEIAKMRRERDRAIQNAAWEADIRRQETERADAAQRSAAAYKGATTRLKNRAKAGVCPCCNRHFANLEAHMKSKHTEEDLTNAVEFGQKAEKA